MLLRGQQTWSGFSPITLPDNNTQSGLHTIESGYRHFCDHRGWKSRLSIVIEDCGRWKSGPCLLGCYNVSQDGQAEDLEPLDMKVPGWLSMEVISVFPYIYKTVENTGRHDNGPFTPFVLRVLSVYGHCKVSIGMLFINSSDRSWLWFGFQCYWNLTMTIPRPKGVKCMSCLSGFFQ